ncbi:MAG: hypothetical protein GEV05_19740 [Betaproteobacteria bacterium]|nr:hypothetical protein [Betaproteobacteria bacterium]
MRVDIVQASGLIALARREGKRIPVPGVLRPACAADAYAIQDAIGKSLGAVAIAPGWKVGAPDASTEPSAAPIYEIHTSPARVPAKRMTMLGVEAEIAVVFERALAPRAEPYDEREVLAAVRELRIAIELCDSRLDDWERADDLTRLADHQLNFALVLGDACARFHDIDFGTLAVLTRVDGRIIKQGTGCHAVGNPLRLLPWAANHARNRGGIGVGTAVTTGAWLGLHRVEPGSTVAVEFVGLGAAEVSFPR